MARVEDAPDDLPVGPRRLPLGGARHSCGSIVFVSRDSLAAAVLRERVALPAAAERGEFAPQSADTAVSLSLFPPIE